jgi:N,N'-diacetyllegionaminate synthase
MTFLPADRVFVIAEAGVNHNGNLDLARRLVDVAADAGADAVKFQSFRAETLASRSAPKADYQIAATGSSESQFEMLKRLELSNDAHHVLMAHCAARNILFLSTPFDEERADFLKSLGVPAFKISSGEITNLPFLAHVATKKKPILLSTGMSDLTEVGIAVETIRGAGGGELALLHCLTNYPADPAEANLRAMRTMADAFALPVGYSDHTPGIEVALAAVALGARLIEKHFTLDRALPGPDHAASLEPDELKALVLGVRTVESALGDGIKRPAPSEANNRRIVRKGLVAAKDIPMGALIGNGDIAVLRPGTGLPPSRRPDVVGKRARTAIAAGTPIIPEMLA